MAASAQLTPIAAAMGLALLAFVRFAVAAVTGSHSAWSGGRLVWTLVVCTAVFLQLGVAVLQAQRPSPVWQQCSVVLHLASLVLLVASYHPGISTQDSSACQFLTPLWLIGSIVLLPVVFLQGPKTSLASLGSFAVGSFALSGLALWLRPFFATGTSAEIVDAVMMLAFFSLVPAVALAQYARTCFLSRQETGPEVEMAQVIGHGWRSQSSEEPPRFYDRLNTGLQYLARHHFRVLVCLDRDGVILSTNAVEHAEELGLLQGEDFPSLFITPDSELMEQLIDEVGFAAEGTYATEKGRIECTGRVLQIEAVCVGGESSGRSGDLHVLLGVEEVEDDGGQRSTDFQALNSRGERSLAIAGGAPGRNEDPLRDYGPFRALPGMCPEAEAERPGRAPPTNDEDARSPIGRHQGLPLRRFFPVRSGQEAGRGYQEVPWVQRRSIASDDLLRDYGPFPTGLAQTNRIGASRPANVEEGLSPVVPSQGGEPQHFLQDPSEEEGV